MPNSVYPYRDAVETQPASASLTFIVKGQVLSWNEKGLFQLHDYFVSFSFAAPQLRLILCCCMQSYYIHAGQAHTYTY